MNTNTEVDRIVQDWLEDRVVEPRLDVLRDVISQVPTTPQTRARLLGRWFDRGRGARRGTDAHDHPPDTHRRNRLMYSATGLVAAFAVLALSVSVVNTDPAPPNAGAGTTYTVDAAGSGDFDTIAEAVAAASDGDTVLVQPGTYTEAIVIDKDITLAGDGPVEEIVIHAPEDGPSTNAGRTSNHEQEQTYAVLLQDSEATLSSLTFRGPDTSIIARGGAPALTGLLFVEAGRPYTGGNSQSSDSMSPIVISAGSAATVRDNRLIDSGGITVSDHSEPLIEGNSLSAEIYGAFGDGTIIRGNTFTDLAVNAIVFSDPSSPLIEGNTIDGAGGSGITSLLSSPKLAPIIRDNTIRGTRTAILMSGGSAATITGNEVTGALIAISLSDANGVIEGNTIRDVSSGISIHGSGAPTITGNTVDALVTGIDVGAGTSPAVDGNTVCGGTSSIKVHASATPMMGENTTCEAA